MSISEQKMHIQNPAAITAGSFAIIRAELSAAGFQFKPPQADIVERIIHTTADFEFAALTRFSPEAIEAGGCALQAGFSAVTETPMVQMGISHSRLASFGGSVHCLAADKIIQQRAKLSQRTCGASAIIAAAEQGLLEGSIVTIGSDPTALYEVIYRVEAGARPALIIGVPVGFVNTVESKEALMRVTTVPWIVTEGRKGGSTVAVAIVNGLLHLAAAAPAIETD
jgi:precorrin-8X/cobalt-precorrin-8 methylmutase